WSPYGFPYAWALLGIVINTDRVKRAPASLADLWQPPFKGMRVGIPGLPNYFGYSWIVKIAQLHGGGLHNLDPGFTALKELNIKYAAPDFVAAYNDLCAGNLDILLWVSDYTLTVEARGCHARFIVPKEGGIIAIAALTV